MRVRRPVPLSEIENNKSTMEAETEVAPAALRIVHLSDLHIGRRKASFANQAAAILAGIATRYGRSQEPVILVVTGDIISSAMEYQYEDAARLFAMLTPYQNIKVLMCPGTHDYYRQGQKVSDWDRWRATGRSWYHQYLGQPIQFPTKYSVPLNAQAMCHFIGLDSLGGEVTADMVDTISTQGVLGAPQVIKLKKMLDQIENPDDKIVVYLHHCPFRVAGCVSEAQVLMDARQLLYVIENRVDLLLFGRDHIEKRWRQEEKQYNIDLILSAGQSTQPVVKMSKLLYEVNGMVQDTWLPSASGGPMVYRFQEIQITDAGLKSDLVQLEL